MPPPQTNSWIRHCSYIELLCNIRCYLELGLFSCFVKLGPPPKQTHGSAAVRTMHDVCVPPCACPCVCTEMHDSPLTLQQSAIH